MRDARRISLSARYIHRLIYFWMIEWLSAVFLDRLAHIHFGQLDYSAVTFN